MPLAYHWAQPRQALIPRARSGGVSSAPSYVLNHAGPFKEADGQGASAEPSRKPVLPTRHPFTVSAPDVALSGGCGTMTTWHTTPTPL